MEKEKTTYYSKISKSNIRVHKVKFPNYY